MAGIFGIVAHDFSVHANSADRLRLAVRTAWPDSEWVEFKSALLGVDSPPGTTGRIRRLPDHTTVAIDGASSTDLALSGTFRGTVEPPFIRRTKGSVTLADDVIGNVVCVSHDGSSWDVLADWTGAFPLYFAHVRGCFIFSSLLRPLAHAIAAEIDLVATPLQFLRFGYMLSGRSFFAGVKRLLPGQHLSYSSPSDQFRVIETSKLWCADHDAPSRHATVDEVTIRLRTAIRRACPASEATALMMSAGWDSRTLLAVAESSESTGRTFVLGYVHGDPSSRELRLVRHISAAAGIKVLENPLGDSVFQPEYLQTRFPQTEDVRFPHWHRAGELLQQQGVRTIACGVYGEVLGGHYGPPFTLRGRSRVDYILRSLAGLPVSVSAAGLLKDVRRWNRYYLTDDIIESATNSPELLAGDIDADLFRLRSRGISDESSLFEAFITEHRGTQMVVAQPLSFRSSSAETLALPYCDRELLGYVTRLPVSLRIHNRLNRGILQREGPQLLRFPTGAVLIPAHAPILLQEASRVVAHLREQRQMKRYVRAAGRLPPSWPGWDNFEFMRKGQCLTELSNDLRATLWNRESIRRHLAQNVYAFGTQRRVFSTVMELLRVYTVDLMLRPLH
jgi:hypothetical protein